MCRAFGAPFEGPINPGLTAGPIHWRPFGPHFNSHSRGHYQLNCYVPLGLLLIVGARAAFQARVPPLRDLRFFVAFALSIWWFSPIVATIAWVFKRRVTLTGKLRPKQAAEIIYDLVNMNLSAIRMIFFDAAGTSFRVRGSVGEIYGQFFPMTQHEPRN